MSTRKTTNWITKILAYTVAAAFLIMLALAVYIANFDINSHRQQLQLLASTALGQKVVLERPLSIDFALSPTIIARQLSLHNTDWASRPFFASIDEVRLKVELYPLLFKQVKLRALS